uniref:Uncharacterized protein n=1 Tax=Arundo donax TaxID=35708 RepID=A0A0A8XP03_ARUDO
MRYQLHLYIPQEDRVSRRMQNHGTITEYTALLSMTGLKLRNVELPMFVTVHSVLLLQTYGRHT